MCKNKVVVGGVLIFLLGLLFMVCWGKEDEPSIEEVSPEKKVIATYAGKELTRADLEMMMRYRGSGRMFLGEPLETLSTERLKSLVEELVGEELIYEKAQRENFQLSAEEQEQLQKMKDNLLVEQLYKTIVEKNVPEISEEKAREVYEKSAEQLTQPFQFSMKHIFLSTYKEYTAQEGDTLESIAEKLCDEPSTAVLRILSAETKEPRYVKPEERDQKPFKPLVPGERLMVPMKKEEKQQVYEKIKKIYQELQDGADFDELAQKYSEVERPGEVIGPIVPEKSEKPILPELLEAAKKTEEGKFSDIIETKHGYQIIKIVSKQEKRQTPFEQVKHRIISQETFKSRREYADNYLKDLLKKSPLIKTYPEILADDKASTSAIVAEIGPEKITKIDFERKLARYIANKTTAAEKLEELFRLPEFIRIVLPAEAKKLNLDKEEAYIKAATQMTIDMYANAYLQKKYQTDIKITDEELKKYYKEHIDKFTTPRQYKLRQILRRIHPQVYTLSAEEKEKLVQERIKELQEIRARIKSVEDFAAMAKEYSDDPATKDKGGEVGYVPESYQRGFDGRLQQLKPGEVSEPFERGIFVYLIMVEDIKEPQVQPFDEVKQNVERYYRSDKQQEIRKNLIEQLLKEANFKFIGLSAYQPEKSEKAEKEEN